MTHGSLFSGIGGFDLAAEWMGWENVFHCEWMPFPRQVLKYYWPKAISYENICTTDFTIHRGDIDILTGGFPCQPYSTAGKRLGKADERHLFPHMLRAIKEIQPRWVIGENVRGLVSWNGGMVFNEVCADLESEGYEVQPFLIPAASVNAPHRRDRIWFVAYSKSQRREPQQNRTKEFQPSQRQMLHGRSGNGYGSEWVTQYSNGIRQKMGDASDSDSNGQQQCDSQYEKHTSKGRLNALGDIDKSNGNGNASDTCSRGMEGHWGKIERQQLQTAEFNQNNSQQFGRMDWEKFPTQSPICNGDDGLSSKLDSITFPKWRNESIKGGGNAIVPQVALQLFKTIQQIEQLKQRQ